MECLSSKLQVVKISLSIATRTCLAHVSYTAPPSRLQSVTSITSCAATGTLETPLPLHACTQAGASRHTRCRSDPMAYLACRIAAMPRILPLRLCNQMLSRYTYRRWLFLLPNLFHVGIFIPVEVPTDRSTPRIL
jgi:hypothetical protein